MESRIVHYKRIRLLWSMLGLAEVIIGLSSMIIGFVNISTGNQVGKLNVVMGSIVAFLAIFFIYISVPVKKKINYLLKEKAIRE